MTSQPSKIGYKSTIRIPLVPQYIFQLLWKELIKMLSKWFSEKLKLPHDPSKLVVFEDFFSRALFVLGTAGSEPYLVDPNRALWKTVIIKIYYMFGLFHLDCLGLGEFITFKQLITDPDQFIIATTMAPCVIFIVSLNYKEYILYFDKKVIHQIFKELRDIFPSTLEDQIEYQTHKYCLFMQKVELIFIVSCMTFTTVYSFMPLVLGVIQILLVEDGEWERALPYEVWYPFDTTEPLSWHIFLFLLQIYGAYLAGVLFVGADVLMCAAIAQNCMHFNCISTRIMNYKPDGRPEDIDFLRGIAEYHGKILE